VRRLAGALTAARGEAAAEAGDADIRRLADVGALPSEALDILDACVSGAPSADQIEELLAAARRVLTAAKRNEPRLISA